MARNRAFERPETVAAREANKVFQSIDEGKAMTEHSLAQRALVANRERLKAERLAREAILTSARPIKPRSR